jgi:hypothetical protein
MLSLANLLVICRLATMPSFPKGAFRRFKTSMIKGLLTDGLQIRQRQLNIALLTYCWQCTSHKTNRCIYPAECKIDYKSLQEAVCSNFDGTGRKTGQNIVNVIAPCRIIKKSSYFFKMTLKPQVDKTCKPPF